MIPLKYRSVDTFVSVDKDLAQVMILIDDKNTTVEDFNKVGAKFLVGDNVDILYHYMLTSLPEGSRDMRMYLESVELPSDSNNQRDRNNWAQMLGVYFMYIRTRTDPSVLVFAPEILGSIVRVNTYYIIEHSYFGDVTDIIIHRTKANLELC